MTKNRWRWMTPAEYEAALETIKERPGMTAAQAAEAFGHTRRQAIRYANADAPVPKLVAAAMRLVLAGRIALDDLMPPPKATS